LDQASISVVALDLDGTLLRPDGTISGRVLAALHECHQAGMRVVIATGRQPVSAARVLPDDLPLSGWVCNNGCDVHLDGQCIEQRLMTPGQARRIVQWVERRWPECPITLVMDGRLYLNRKVDVTFEYEVADLAAVATDPVAKVVVNLASLEGVEEIHDHLPEGCRIVISDNGDWGEIFVSSASKAEGLAVLLKRWGLTLGNVIAFGDETNDLEMLECAGIGVAMGNAGAAPKAVADVIAPTVEEDGVAVVLEALLAGGRRAVTTSLET
jgi:hypothetical protein